ncbi:hypothetical protein OROHE_007391 [Orobanche hederae]
MSGARPRTRLSHVQILISETKNKDNVLVNIVASIQTMPLPIGRAMLFTNSAIQEVRFRLTSLMDFFIDLEVIFEEVHDFGFFHYDPSAIKFLSYEEIPLAPKAACVGLAIRVVGNANGEKDAPY